VCSNGVNFDAGQQMGCELQLGQRVAAKGRRVCSTAPGWPNEKMIRFRSVAGADERQTNSTNREHSDWLFHTLASACWRRHGGGAAANGNWPADPTKCQISGRRPAERDSIICCVVMCHTGPELRAVSRVATTTTTAASFP
jgi:hypothetical protein